LHFGDRQTDEQMDSTDALNRSRCRERRLNKYRLRNKPLDDEVTALWELPVRWGWGVQLPLNVFIPL